VSLDLFSRRLGDTEHAVAVGVRLPLSVFHNLPGRRETRADLAAAEVQARAVRNQLDLRLQTAYQKLAR
jgi:hypothetical protein